ncbi:MAG: hypothetical protein LBC99_06190 [Spirochaetota bacterium]|jgi:hypothetical protein|nr:hypothetical protein [Spirochaetota bacterium]
MREFLYRFASLFFIFTLPALIITLNIAAWRKGNLLSIAISVITLASSIWSGLLIKRKFALQNPPEPYQGDRAG